MNRRVRIFLSVLTVAVGAAILYNVWLDAYSWKQILHGHVVWIGVICVLLGAARFAYSIRRSA